MRTFGKIFVWFLGVGMVALALVLALASSYTSPDSRLWASKLGYPIIARSFDWPIPVETELVITKKVMPSVSAEGTLQYEHRVPITIEVLGIVDKVNVKVGDTVERGAVLIQLDLGGREVQMAKLDIALKLKAYRATTENLERQSRLLEDGLLQQDTFYKYERDQREAGEELAIAEESLKLALSTRSAAVFRSLASKDELADDTRLNILSPINGQVTQIDVAEGETLATPRRGSVVLGANLMFRSFIDQLHFGQVEIGQEATIYLLARPNTMIKGKVSRIEPFVAGGEARGGVQPNLTFAVWVEFVLPAGEERSITQGMNGYVILSYPSEEIVISSKALLRYSGGQGLVLVVDEENIVTIRSVEYAWSDGIQVAIKKGLEVGERVVTAGQVALQEGDEVELK